ncbi:MAG TPA: hypothetical protein VJ799_01700 [Nitrososphaeraceae archaeon]|nr:hypothetical protein [Nitrososphaeraceae archaeon]
MTVPAGTRAKVMTMPAAVISFKKSRPDTRGRLLVEPPRLISITSSETCAQRACDEKRLGY